MSDLCTDRFREVAATLGGIDCESPNPVGYLNDPTKLASWTMPVIEVVFVLAAVLALAHAVQHLRRHGDATNLGVWLAAVVYVLVLEPPLYFPKAFGIDGYVPAIFVHNEFTVGFLFDRLPLYIACLYPAMVYLAWVVVQRLGVQERYGRWAGAVVTAVCVGFVHHTFYEIFDMLGPQRLWWAWDYELPMAHLRIASVPMMSVVNFALVMPAAFAFLACVLLGRRDRPTVRSVLLPALGVGALTPLVSAPGQLPITVIDLVDNPPFELIRVILWAMLLVAGILTLREVLHARPTAPEPGLLGSYPFLVGGGYLVAFLVLWSASADEVLDDDPLAGSLAYTGVCFVLCTALLVRLWRKPRAGSGHDRDRAELAGRP